MRVLAKACNVASARKGKMQGAAAQLIVDCHTKKEHESVEHSCPSAVLVTKLARREGDALRRRASLFSRSPGKLHVIL